MHAYCKNDVLDNIFRQAVPVYLFCLLDVFPIEILNFEERGILRVAGSFKGKSLFMIIYDFSKHSLIERESLV